jgi:hypothetical protein
MTREWTDAGLDFEGLRWAIEHRDPEVMLDFYAEDARLTISNTSFPHASPFELYGKAEIAKHMHRGQAPKRIPRKGVDH